MPQSSILPVYRRADILMVKGEGCYLFDEHGKRYLDFAAGIAVNALGHCHPKVVGALKQQADILWHCANLYRTPWLEAYADMLVAASPLDSVFFSSSGGEAVEAAIKFARRYHWHKGAPHKHRIITFTGGYHGRTITGISAGGNPVAKEGFAPLLEGFDRVQWHNSEAVKAAVTKDTAAILLEPVQGEGGVREASAEWLATLRHVANEHGLLLMFDEVQCGLGRTGSLFTSEQSGVVPDIITIAKGIGNGFPLAATLVNSEVAASISPGCHGSTYGANPLAMTVGQAVLEVMQQENFFSQLNTHADYLKTQLNLLGDTFPHLVKEVRGRGLMLGLQMHADARQVAHHLREAGLLTAPTSEDNVIRIVPPLIINDTHIKEAIQILTHTLSQYKEDTL